MCFFIFGITEHKVDESLVKELEKINLYVRDYTGYVRDSKPNHHYYEINNGHCACELVVSPFGKVKGIREIIDNLGNKGQLRLVVLDSECEDEYLLQEENQNLEALLSTLPSEKLSLDELLMKYPEKITFDKIYQL